MLDCIHTIRDKGGECQLIEPSPCIIIPDDPKKPLSQAITTPKVAVLTFDLNPSSNKLGYVNNTSSMSTEQVDRMLKHEDEFYKKLAVQVRKLGINVIILQEKLTSAEDPVPEAAAKLFTRAKVTVLRPFQKEQIRMVCDVSGIRPIVSHSQLFELSKDTASAHVFDFKSINPILVSIPYIQIVPETVKRNHVSIVLGGPTLTAIEEIDRALHDVLRVLESSCLSNGVVPGGGACEMAISAFISNKMQSMESIHGTVVESFCKGLEQIPRLLCERAGLNPTGCMNRLKIAHSTEPKCKKGIFLGEQNGICDLAERGVLELLENKLMLIRMATQTAIQVLKIDGVHQVKS
jgi:chaperonin GroEL (HSP60 family)